MKGFVTLKAASPFYHVFAGGVVPVRDTTPRWMELDSIGEVECYMLDTESCGGFTLSAVAEVLARCQGADPRIMREYLYNHGDLPIRKTETVGETNLEIGESGKEGELPPSRDLRFFQ